jgi:hypothetical protein
MLASEVQSGEGLPDRKAMLRLGSANPETLEESHECRRPTGDLP